MFITLSNILLPAPPVVASNLMSRSPDGSPPLVTIPESFTRGAESQAGESNRVVASGNGDTPNVVVHLSVDRAPLLMGTSVSSTSSTSNGNGNVKGSRASDGDTGAIAPADPSDLASTSIPSGNLVVRFFLSARHCCRWRCRCYYRCTRTVL